MPQSPLSVAQITDTHLFADEEQKLLGLSTLNSLQAAVKQLAMLPKPDLVLLTGDLSQDGTAQSYTHLQNLLTPLSLPTYWIPGNHDCINTMQQVLNQAPVSPNKTFKQGGWQFILLDSTLTGYVDGYLSPTTLNLLNSQLELANDLPTLIALHHPPCKVNSDWIDAIGLRDSAGFFAILDRHPQVKLVLFGHIHQEFNWQRQNVHYLGAPATSIQFKPQSSEFSIGQETPGFRRLNLYPDGTWETRIERVAYAERLDLAATGY